MLPNCASKPQWAHLEYTWRLENFWELRALASIEALEEDSGDVIWSSLFGEKKKGLWRLKVYPYGDSSAAGRGHASLFLALDTKALGPGAKLYAIFGCFVLDSAGQKIEGSGRSFTRQKFAEGSASWGWSQFIKSDDLMGMLVDDALTIKCTIDIFAGIRSSAGRELPSPSFKDEIVAFLRQKQCQDVEVIVDDETFLCNSMLLSARSGAFRRLLNGKDEGPTHNAISLKSNESNGTHQVVEIHSDHIPADAAEQMLEFIMNDSCELLTSKAPELARILQLLIAACICEVESLKLACIGHLLGRIITTADAKMTMEIAQKYNCDMLVQECREFLQMVAPDLQGPELMKLLLPRSVPQSSPSSAWSSSISPTS